jgi:hypothetical protein
MKAFSPKLKYHMTILWLRSEDWALLKNLDFFLTDVKTFEGL